MHTPKKHAREGNSGIVKIYSKGRENGKTKRRSRHSETEITNKCGLKSLLPNSRGMGFNLALRACFPSQEEEESVSEQQHQQGAAPLGSVVPSRNELLPSDR